MQSAGNSTTVWKPPASVFTCALISLPENNCTPHVSHHRLLTRTTVRALGASLAESMFFQTPPALICAAIAKQTSISQIFPWCLFLVRIRQIVKISVPTNSNNKSKPGTVTSLFQKSKTVVWKEEKEAVECLTLPSHCCFFHVIERSGND